MIDLQPLVNKNVPFKFKGAELKLDLSHALFSSFNVDVGTRLLLKAVGRDEVLAGARRVLDAGSGVGVIGVAVAKAFPEARVEARDRDLLACAFTERNGARNKAPNLLVRPGLLATGAAVSAAHPDPALPGGGYDFILSNLPAKAGGPVLEAFFKGAASLLAPGGRLAVVIVKPLVEAALAWIEGAGLDIVSSERGSGHMAWVLAPRAAAPSQAGAAQVPAAAAPTQSQAAAAPAPPQAGVPGAAQPVPASAPAEGPELDLSGLDLGVYLRRRGRFRLGEASYEASGYWGLPDFDTVGFSPRVAAELAERAIAGILVREALVVNPGLGHFPLWLARRAGPARIQAASRDLLSLAATGANLAALAGRRPAYRALDALRLDELPSASLDLLAEFPDAVPEYDWIEPLWDRAFRLLKRGATFLLAATPTELARAEKRRPQGFRLLGDRRRKGQAAMAWRRD